VELNFSPAKKNDNLIEKKRENFLEPLKDDLVVFLAVFLFYLGVPNEKNRFTVRKASRRLSSVFRFRHKKRKKTFRKIYLSLFRNKLIARFSRNRYFLRILNAFFIAFSLNIFDPMFIVNSLVYEFQVLQRRQKMLLFLAKRLLRVLFNKYKDKLRLRGIKIQLKGKITLWNRQIPRKQKKKIEVGIIRRNNVMEMVNRYDAPAFSRFGVLHVSVTYQHNYAVYSERSLLSTQQVLRSSYASKFSSKVDARFLSQGFAICNLLRSQKKRKPSFLSVLKFPRYKTLLSFPVDPFDRSKFDPQWQKMRKQKFIDFYFPVVNRIYPWFVYMLNKKFKVRRFGVKKFDNRISSLRNFPLFYSRLLTIPGLFRDFRMKRVRRKHSLSKFFRGHRINTRLFSFKYPTKRAPSYFNRLLKQVKRSSRHYLWRPVYEKIVVKKQSVPAILQIKRKLAHFKFRSDIVWRPLDRLSIRKLVSNPYLRSFYFRLIRKRRRLHRRLLRRKSKVQKNKNVLLQMRFYRKIRHPFKTISRVTHFSINRCYKKWRKERPNFFKFFLSSSHKKQFDKSWLSFYNQRTVFERFLSLSCPPNSYAVNPIRQNKHLIKHFYSSYMSFMVWKEKEINFEKGVLKKQSLSTFFDACKPLTVVLTKRDLRNYVGWIKELYKILLNIQFWSNRWTRVLPKRLLLFILSISETDNFAESMATKKKVLEKACKQYSISFARVYSFCKLVFVKFILNSFFLDLSKSGFSHDSSKTSEFFEKDSSAIIRNRFLTAKGRFFFKWQKWNKRYFDCWKTVFVRRKPSEDLHHYHFNKAASLVTSNNSSLRSQKIGYRSGFVKKHSWYCPGFTSSGSFFLADSGFQYFHYLFLEWQKRFFFSYFDAAFSDLSSVLIKDISFESTRTVDNNNSKSSDNFYSSYFSFRFNQFPIFQKNNILPSNLISLPFILDQYKYILFFFKEVVGLRNFVYKRRKHKNQLYRLFYNTQIFLSTIFHKYTVKVSKSLCPLLVNFDTTKFSLLWDKSSTDVHKLKQRKRALNFAHNVTKFGTKAVQLVTVQKFFSKPQFDRKRRRRVVFKLKRKVKVTNNLLFEKAVLKHDFTHPQFFQENIYNSKSNNTSDKITYAR